MTESWNIEGDFVEACNCDVACQCIWLEPPDDDVCTSSLVWHINSGNYGDIDLSGLNISMLIYTEKGVMFAPDTGWHVILLVDEEANNEEKSALEDIFLGRVGGIFTPVADTHFETTEVETVPFTFNRDESYITVNIDDSVTMDVFGKTGFNEELGTITPHPLTNDFKMNTGKSKTATVSYGNKFSWDVSGNNSYFGDFQLSNN